MGSVNFSAFENLTGGSMDDRFVFRAAADGFGTISGGSGGNDTLDYSTAGGPITINLQTGTAPKTTSIGYFESLVGSGGMDTLIGVDGGRTWTLTGLNAGTVGLVAFDKFENLTGGSGNDTFKLSGSGALAGSINGGGGLNVLDYSFYGLPGVSVDLQAGTATAIGGGLSQSGHPRGHQRERHARGRQRREHPLRRRRRRCPATAAPAATFSSAARERIGSTAVPARTSSSAARPVQLLQRDEPLAEPDGLECHPGRVDADGPGLPGASCQPLQWRWSERHLRAQFDAR